jgi:YHS domain-containing protein
METNVRAKDPVCGMSVDPSLTDLVTVHEGRRYYFCAKGCQTAFEKNPRKYLKHKGFLGRFIDRLGKTNQETFGSGGPSCCH